MPQFLSYLAFFVCFNSDCMCILSSIILPKPIQYFKAKIIFFFVFLLYLKHFSFFLKFSFPVFLLLVASFTTWAFPRRVPVSGGVVQEHLVHAFERLSEIVLQGRERGANGRGAEAVRDEAEVREAALDPWLQDGAGPAVPDGRPVLRQQIRKFFTKLPVKSWERNKNSPLVSLSSAVERRRSYKPRGTRSP